jgi:hypothetical protein
VEWVSCSRLRVGGDAMCGSWQSGVGHARAPRVRALTVAVVVACWRRHDLQTACRLAQTGWKDRLQPCGPTLSKVCDLSIVSRCCLARDSAPVGCGSHASWRSRPCCRRRPGPRRHHLAVGGPSCCVRAVPGVFSVISYFLNILECHR